MCVLLQLCMYILVLDIVTTEEDALKEEELLYLHKTRTQSVFSHLVFIRVMTLHNKGLLRSKKHR